MRGSPRRTRSHPFHPLHPSCTPQCPTHLQHNHRRALHISHHVAGQAVAKRDLRQGCRGPVGNPTRVVCCFALPASARLAPRPCPHLLQLPIIHVTLERRHGSDCKRRRRRQRHGSGSVRGGAKPGAARLAGLRLAQLDAFQVPGEGLIGAGARAVADLSSGGGGGRGDQSAASSHELRASDLADLSVASRLGALSSQPLPSWRRNWTQCPSGPRSSRFAWETVHTRSVPLAAPLLLSGCSGQAVRERRQLGPHPRPNSPHPH